MPVGNAFRRPPRHQHAMDDNTAKWAVPIGRVAGIRVSFSYTVFFAAAVLVAAALSLAARPGNSDLPKSFLWGALFWVSGWLAQAITFSVSAHHSGSPLKHLNIGLIGVETMAGFASAVRAISISIATVSSLLMLGSFYRLVEGGFQLPSLASPTTPIWTAPSIGFRESDAIWRSAAWLCWVQAVLQLYPLPATMGRQLVGGLVAICGRRVGMDSQIQIFRRCVGLLALLTMGVAIWLMMSETTQLAPKWPLVVVLALLLWVSGNGNDVVKILNGFDRGPQATPDETPATVDQGSRVGVIETAGRSWKEWRRNRKLRKVLRQEHDEACDAARVDEILNRLHREGAASLSTEDRKILDRVSESLRKQRESETNRPSN